MILSHHTARAIDNPVARGVLHRERFIPVSAFILPRFLTFQEILRVDVGIHPVPGLHVSFHLHIAWSEQLVLVRAELIFPGALRVPVSVEDPVFTLVVVPMQSPSVQGSEKVRVKIVKGLARHNRTVIVAPASELRIQHLDDLVLCPGFALDKDSLLDAIHHGVK